MGYQLGFGAGNAIETVPQYTGTTSDLHEFGRPDSVGLQDLNLRPLDADYGPGQDSGEIAGSNHSAASGGSTMIADAGRPCQGSPVASTAP
jgi:hypothetical protein